LLKIEILIFYQSELACPELVEGKTDERKLEIMRMFDSHPSTLRLTQGRLAQDDIRFEIFLSV